MTEQWNHFVQTGWALYAVVAVMLARICIATFIAGLPLRSSAHIVSVLAIVSLVVVRSVIQPEFGAFIAEALTPTMVALLLTACVFDLIALVVYRQ